MNPNNNGNPPPPPPPAGPPLTLADATSLLLRGLEAQQTQVATVVARAFDEARRRGGTPTGGGEGNANSRLKSDEVGYFNPTAKDMDGTGITSSGKLTVYTDVYTFTNRLRHLAETRGEQAVKEVWTTCLQSTALSWHSTELTNLERTALSNGNLDLVCSELERQFKRNVSVALSALQGKKLTLLDIRQGKTLRPFIQSVVKDAQACGLSEPTQVVWAFEACDSQIQAIVGKPQSTTTLGQFLVEVDRQESVIQARARELYPQYGPQPPQATQPISAYGYNQHQNWYPQSQYPQPYSQFNPNARGGYGYGYGNRGRGRGNNYANTGYRNQYNNWGQNRYGQNQNNQNPGQQNFRGGYNQNPGVQQRNPQGQDQQTPGQAPRPWNDQRPNPQFRQRQPYQNQNRQGQFRQQGRAYHADDGAYGELPFPDHTEQNWQYEQTEYPPFTDQEYEYDNPGAFDQNPDTPREDAAPPQDGFDLPPPDHTGAAYFATASTSEIQHECRTCGDSFDTRNRLFTHLNEAHGVPSKDKKRKDGQTDTPEKKVHFAYVANHQMNISSLLVPPERNGLHGVGTTPPTRTDPSGRTEPTRTDQPSEHRTRTDRPSGAFSKPTHHPLGGHTDNPSLPQTANPSTIRLQPAVPPVRNQNPTEPGRPVIIKSKVDSRVDTGTGYGFRSWTYLKYFVTPDPDTGVQEDACGDTGCSKSLADRHWIAKHYPQLQIRHRAQPLTVRGIGDDFHQTSDYVVMPLYFKGTADGRSAYAFFEREVSLVSGLQANMLIGMDILGAEQFDILNSKGITVIGSCGVTVNMDSGHRGRQQRSVVRASEHAVVPPRAYHKLAVEHNIRNDGQDLLFDPAPWNKFAAFALLADANMSDIVIRNDTEKPMVIPRGANVGHIESLDPLSTCLHVDTASDEDMSGMEEYATSKPPQQQKDKIVPDTNLLLSNAKTVKHKSGITIYDDPEHSDTA